MKPEKTTPERMKRFDPVSLGRELRRIHDTGQRHFVTFLIGAGFSRSTGIPGAGEIVKELRGQASNLPFLTDVGSCPEGISEYAFLMGELGGPAERAQRIKDYVSRARLSDDNPRLKINWAHLLLAIMAEDNYINRILTTNFDPLVVEALAAIGQPIRTYDLNTTGNYFPGALDPGAIIYLHGQMHSLYLANSRDEVTRVSRLYPPVLQEAITNSFLIVVGYSGDCDPVLDSLLQLRSFPRGLWWSHYGSSEPGDAVRRLFQEQGADCHLAVGDDADMFMRKLVMEGMHLDPPNEIRDPLRAARDALERILPLPSTGNMPGVDPLKSARKLLDEIEKKMSEQQVVSSSKESADSPESSDLMTLMINWASESGDWSHFDAIRQKVKPNPQSSISQAVGLGLMRKVETLIEKEKSDEAFTTLDEVEKFGVPASTESWVPALRGNVFLALARVEENKNQANNLFHKAYNQYEEALRIKPDMHEAYNNWGSALLEQAKRTDDAVERTRLFSEAGAKYAESVRIKPDNHDVYNNWGTALIEQAKRTDDAVEQSRLFLEAGAKFAEAVRIKPDMHEAYNNWGSVLLEQAKRTEDAAERTRLFSEARAKYAEAVQIKPDKHSAYFNTACLHALLGDVRKCCAELAQWKKFNPAANRADLDGDTDFDLVRKDPEFIAFHASLPD